MLEQSQTILGSDVSQNVFSFFHFFLWPLLRPFPGSPAKKTFSSHGGKCCSSKVLGLAETSQQCGWPQGHLLCVTCQAQTPPVQELWLSAMARQGCRDGAKLSLAYPGSGSMARRRLALVQHPWGRGWQPWGWDGVLGHGQAEAGLWMLGEIICFFFQKLINTLTRRWSLKLTCANDTELTGKLWRNAV